MVILDQSQRGDPYCENVFRLLRARLLQGTFPDFQLTIGPNITKKGLERLTTGFISGEWKPTQGSNVVIDEVITPFGYPRLGKYLDRDGRIKGERLNVGDCPPLILFDACLYIVYVVTEPTKTTTTHRILLWSKFRHEDDMTPIEPIYDPSGVGH